MHKIVLSMLSIYWHIFLQKRLESPRNKSSQGQRKSPHCAEAKQYLKAALELMQDMKYFLAVAENKTDEDSYTSMGAWEWTDFGFDMVKMWYTSQTSWGDYLDQLRILWLQYFQTASFWFHSECGIPHMIAADSILDGNCDNKPSVFERNLHWLRNGRGQTTMQTWEVYQQTWMRRGTMKLSLLWLNHWHAVPKGALCFPKLHYFLSAGMVFSKSSSSNHLRSIV